jgi:predicted dehydrogenase
MDSSGPARRDFLKTAGGAMASAAVLSTSLRALAQEQLTIALVGGAHIHTPGFVKLLANERTDVKVKYVWDHDAPRAERRSEELPGSRVVADPGVIWSDPEVQAVVICSETNRHAALVAAAARTKKHMFVEKPLGITAQESRAMADAIEQAKLLFTTGYFMRTDPKHLFLKEQIDKGVFGTITRARGSNCHSGSLGGWFDTEWRWMADPAIAGVGAFGDLGTHSLDILMWLLGDVASITADIKVVTGRYGDCDESGEALFQFRNGVIGSLAAGWVDVADPVTLVVSGTEAHAAIIRGELYFSCRGVPGADGTKPWRTLPPAPRLPLHQFLDAVAGQPGMPLVTPTEAAARVAVMEAAYRAARTKTWMPVS